MLDNKQIKLNTEHLHETRVFLEIWPNVWINIDQSTISGGHWKIRVKFDGFGINSVNVVRGFYKTKIINDVLPVNPRPKYT